MQQKHLCASALLFVVSGAIVLSASVTNLLPVTAQERFVRSRLVVDNGQQPRKTEIIQICNAQATDLANALTKLFENAVLVADPVTNKLTITIEPKDLTQLKKKIVELDAPVPQIRIDCKLTELGKNETIVAAAPSITTADGQAARVLVGQNMPIRTEKDGSLTYADIGMQFLVLAKKQMDGRWQVDCTLEITALRLSTLPENANNMKVVSRTTRCVATVQSGDTVQVEVNLDDFGHERSRMTFTVHEIHRSIPKLTGWRY